MDLQTISDANRVDIDDLLEVIVSDDNMTGYIRLKKMDKEEAPDGEELPAVVVTADHMMQALAKERIVYGIKEETIHKLAARPIYGIKIEVAKGTDPVDGEDGYVNFYVKRDSEYKPEYDEEGIIDYKNLDYFQQVKEGQLLCEVVKETEGTDGINIFGNPVAAKSGRSPVSPMGKNTVFNEDGTKLMAACSGVVRFVKDYIDINEVLHVRNVDQSTGNINFPGDVIVDGDVHYGFSVKSGGNVTIKGVIEGAFVEAAGNVHVSRGINGSGGKRVVAGGNLRSGYIENADLLVEGDIITDYIIDSNIVCNGNITLVGKNERIIGGSVKLLGELTARYIGNERERPTRIEVMGVVIADTETIQRLKMEREEYESRFVKLAEILNHFSRLSGYEEEENEPEELRVVKQQAALLKEQIDLATRKIEKLEKEIRVEYPGAILCKRKIYQGVRIYFGNEMFRFELDDIERCRIFWSEGEILQGTL
ncbi:MAG: DUF342 domain-containing protein [Anaerovoracaceae bacterium]|jgi:uncharacterized protein (DUF342 family)